MAAGKFATSVSCMDGRIQFPLGKWIKENYLVDFVDVITEPGIDKQVADDINVESIKARVGISVNAHKSELIAISGHHDCAGNPVSDEQHISQIKDSVKVISSWGFNLKVIGLWVDDSWNVRLV